MRRVALAIALLATHAAAAPPAPEGPTFTVFSRSDVTRFPDVAYDSASGAFLVVSGQLGVTARFVSAAGPDGDPFEVTTEPSALDPRVAGTGDGFLVCWLVEDEAAVKCRSVRRAGATADLGAVQIVDSGEPKHTEGAPSLACAPTECLVTWVTANPEIGVRARRVALDGAPTGDAMDVATTPGVFEAFPAVVYGPSRNEYLVAYTKEPGSQAMTIWGARVPGSTFEAFGADGLCNYPEIAHDPERDRMLSIAWISEGNPDVGGRLFSSDGTAIGDRIAIAATSGFEGGDGIGLAFDTALDTYLAVYQGPETPGVAQEVWAAAVDVDGSPSPQFQATQALATNGVYQPRVAADGQGRFLVVTVVDYQRIDGQFVVGEVPAAPDAGSPDAGGSGGSGGTDAGSSPGGRGSTSEGDGGCGCRTSPAPSRGAALWLAFLLLARRRTLHTRRLEAIHHGATGRRFRVDISTLGLVARRLRWGQ